VTARRGLPEPFGTVPFRVGDALAAGIPRHRLDARDLVRLHHGWVVVHVRAHDLFGMPGELVGRLLRRLRAAGYVHLRAIDLTRTPRFVP
jgi:hypothetical protein